MSNGVVLPPKPLGCPLQGTKQSDNPPTPLAASWRSGDAADCKSVYTGSIPVLASITPFPIDFLQSGSNRPTDFIGKIGYSPSFWRKIGGGGSALRLLVLGHGAGRSVPTVALCHTKPCARNQAHWVALARARQRAKRRALAKSNCFSYEICAANKSPPSHRHGQIASVGVPA